MDIKQDSVYLGDSSLILTHYGEEYEKYFSAIVPPIFMNSLNVFKSIEDYYNTNPYENKDKYAYGRQTNATAVIAERKIAALEKGNWAALFASGMAATSAAIIACCSTEDKIVCVRNVYGPVKEYLTELGPKMRLQTTYVKGVDLEEFEKAIDDKTRLVILESPSTALFTVQDISGVCKIAKKHGAKVFIDNTYCTPLFQNPLEMGVDLVMHTASKYFGGHSDLIGGVLVGRDDALRRNVLTVERELMGGIIGPMEAWLILRGLRTMEIRLERHQKTALKVAAYLERHPKIKAVHYPGLESHPQRELILRQQRGSCGLMSFELDGDVEQAKKVVNSLKLFKIGVSWGGFESLVCMPYLKQKDAFAQLGGGQNLIRLHCGLEKAEFLIEDLEQAIDSI